MQTLRTVPAIARPVRTSLLAAIGAVALVAAGVATVRPASADEYEDCGYVVTGRLVDAHGGAALAGWNVLDYPDSGGTTATTDAQGGFRFESCQPTATGPESHDLIARTAGRVFTEANVTSFDPPTDGHTIDLGTQRVERPTSISGRLLSAAGKPIVGAGVTAYTAAGKAVRFEGGVADPPTTDKHGYFQLREAKPGTYRLGFTVNFEPVYQQRQDLSSASFFWSSHGPTSSFAAATRVVLRDSSETGAVRSFAKVLHAPGGARAAGTITGAWEDGLYLGFQRIGNPSDAATVVNPTWANAKNLKQGETFVKVRYRSTPLLPGRYRLSTYGISVDSHGAASSRTFYYTGPGRKPTTSPSKAKTIVVRTGQKAVELGAFDTSRH